MALIATAFGACASSGGSTRTVQVDAASDDFAGTFRAFFPRDVTVKPGMTLKFHQTWSGEPHTVTMGTAVQDLIEPEMLPLVLKSKVNAVDDSNLSDEVNAAAEKFFGMLPFFFGEKGVDQAAAQPCVMKTGLPKGDKACAITKLPAFTGRESYYSSGFIPYRGEQGNEFEMKIASDAKPGTYFYYCNLHGPDMNGQIIVTDKGDAPSQADVNRQAKAEIDAIAKPLLAQLDKERAGKGELSGNLAGSGSESLRFVKGQVNEFTPRTVEAKVGEPVTWTFIQNHTISFNVPKYVPFYDVKRNGTVVQSETIYAPAGGFPGRSVPTPDDGPPIAAETVDAGKFNGGGGLKSSGIDWQTGDKYVVTFTKAGTYPMACLVHPGMIGKVVVS
jgi:plastocyanin